MARVTLQTIADQLGVSRMTVSNAFSRPDQLSVSLRSTILDAARQLGYVGPDPAARALARGTTGAVGVLLTSSLRYAFDDEVATGFLSAVAEEVAPTGLAITLLSEASSAGTGDVVPARDVAMDGAVVYSCDPGLPAIEWLTRRGLPIVFVDQQPTQGLHCVNVDDRGGARAAARHLVDLGHRDFAVVLADIGTSSVVGDEPAGPAGCSKYVSRERLLGYLDVLDEAGISPVVRAQVHSADEQAYAAGVELLDRPDRPTAVLCFSDVVAHAVVRAAQQLGLDVPGDVSVVGFDDSALARRLRPELTTVHQDIRAKGRLAAAALRSAMDPEDDSPVEQVLLPTELIVRASTAPPPGWSRRAER